MILVDVFVPSVDKTYDFQINENAPIYTVLEEISEMIGQKERSGVVGDVNKLQLCDRESRSVLDKNRTLADYEISTGKSLILV